ncbi:MAG: hypothetical protein R2854_18900 [Caldilineaceae bacterium]
MAGDEPTHGAVLDTPIQRSLQNAMIDGREKLPHIALEHVAVAAHPALALIDGPVRAFPDSVRI